jgi:hypothetical protein|tara:strand:- start:463 stop:618 length:156 start_codon:yes stop_codon:yes gene_type:complete
MSFAITGVKDNPKDTPTPTIPKAKRFENDLNANIIISFSLEIGLLAALEPF